MCRVRASGDLYKKAASAQEGGGSSGIQTHARHFVYFECMFAWWT